MSVYWYKCIASLSLEPHAGSAPHSILRLTSGGLLGLPANMVLHLKLTHWTLWCLEAVGVAFVPHGIPILCHLGQQVETEKTEDSSSTFVCMPVPWHGLHQEAWCAKTYLGKLL